jgi:hypothetical protein
MAPSEESLTDTQRLVLQYVQDHLTQSHRPPTVREVMRHFKWNSPQSARKHLLAGRPYRPWIKIIRGFVRGRFHSHRGTGRRGAATLG